MPPFGIDDMPWPVPGELVVTDAGTMLEQTEFRSHASPHDADRALSWRPSHPRDAAVLAALRHQAGVDWEQGPRVALDLSRPPL